MATGLLFVFLLRNQGKWSLPKPEEARVVSQTFSSALLYHYSFQCRRKIEPHTSLLSLQQAFLFPAFISAVSTVSREAKLDGRFAVRDSLTACVEGKIHFNKNPKCTGKLQWVHRKQDKKSRLWRSDVQGLLFLQKAVQFFVEYTLRSFAGWWPY